MFEEETQYIFSEMGIEGCGIGERIPDSNGAAVHLPNYLWDS